MDLLNSYGFLMAASLALIFSYFFTRIARKTGIPSVLLLILLGIVVQQVLQTSDSIEEINLMPVLEVLGIVGLIMIVLEAALDLNLTKEKTGIILRSFFTALIGLGGAAFLIAWIIKGVFTVDWQIAFLYAIPLAIMSSAIIIPSVSNMAEHRKEFMIYEATFSDILGIMFFYFLLEGMEAEPGTPIGMHITLNIVLTIVLSFVLSYLLIFAFSRMKSGTKFFLLLAVLVFLYSIGKSLHLSSLLIILVFGLIMKNSHLFIRGRIDKLLNTGPLDGILKELHMITIESSFLVRTFFFIVFGMTIVLAKLLEAKVFLVSLLVIAAIYLVRFVVLLLFARKNVGRFLLIAPRGLITILLFYGIPEHFKADFYSSFEGILLYVILISSILMAFTMIKNRKKGTYTDIALEIEEYLPDELTSDSITNTSDSNVEPENSRHD